jgi:hypothetical protein
VEHEDDDIEVEVTVTHRGRLADRWVRFDSWRRRLTTELTALPDTLATFRRGANNFEVVSQRLAESSDALEQMTKVYEATLADSARRSADVAKALRSQVDTIAAAGSPERAMGALKEMQRLVGTFQQLNPFWPTAPTVPDEPDDEESDE